MLIILMINSNSFRIPILVWFLSFISILGFSQKLIVETSLRDTITCPNTSLIIPVNVANMISVDSFLLTLNYNPSALTYNTFQQVNSNLAAGTFRIAPSSGVLFVSWKKGTDSESIIGGKMVDLIFKTRVGNSSLAWDTIQPGKCFYFSNGVALPAIFTSSSINLYPALSMSLIENNPTCANADTCTANYRAFVSGGSKPYAYIWNNVPHTIIEYDSLQGELCDGSNRILITDTNGCKLDSIFDIKGLPATSIEIIVSPEDTVYKQNPTIYVSFKNKSDVYISDWLWKFGDGDSVRLIDPNIPYPHTYIGIESFQGKSYPLSLWVKNGFGCDTTITLDIQIQESKLFIPSVFSPNASQERNRTFRIVKDDSHEDLTGEYLSLELQVFNRYGKRVYKNSNYQSDWDGGGLSDGVYYYVLNAHGFFRVDKFKGSVTILGGGR